MSMKSARILLSVLVALSAAGSCRAQGLRIERIDPPHWWVGMKDDRLQLMVHGPGVADATANLVYPGVRIDNTTRTSNPNYLFINLEIAPGTAPGPLDLTLRLGNQSQLVHYELRGRERGSAERNGYTSADVVLNLMPDRFANGNPANDNVPGYTEQADRSRVGGRHGGDIQGIIDHLDHIAAMGYTVIWPTPLTESNQPSFSYHGYATTDMYRIDPRFGSLDDYRNMVILARGKGLCVIQDVVPNHIGSGHWWMKDLPAPDWLGFDNHFVPTNHAHTTASDPYVATADRERFTSGWFDANMPDMNQRNPLVATYEIQNAIWWVEEVGLCGLRVDTYGYSASAFIGEWTRRILQEYPLLNIVGEEWSDNPVVQAYWLRGRINADGYVPQLPSVMDFVLHGALRKALTEPDTQNTGLARLYESLVNDQLYPDAGNLMLFEGNHDTPRLASIFDDDPALVRMALVYVLTMKRVPQLYYGTEVLMTGSKKINSFDAFRSDFPGGWAGDTVNAFSGAGLTSAQAAAQSWLRRLLNWRKTQPVIHHGALKHFRPEDGTYVYFRYDAKDTAKGMVMVVLNKASEERVLSAERFREFLAPDAAGTDILTGARLALGKSIAVPARSSLVVQLDSRPE